MMLKLRLILFASIISLPVWAWNSPTIGSPTAGSNQFIGVTLNWGSISNSTAYQVQWDTTSLFNSTLFTSVTKVYINSSGGNSDTQQNPNNLRFGQLYYWRVRAYISNDTSAWTNSTFNTFDFVSLSSPASGSNTWVYPILNWQPHSGVSFYDVQIDSSTYFNSPFLQQTSTTYINSTDGNGDTQWSATNLHFGTLYYWRVRARSTVDTSAWSTSWNINTNNYVTQSSPSSGTNTWTTATLNWIPHTGVSFYDVQIDSSNTFTSSDLRQVSNAYINSTDGNSDTQWSASNLYFGKTYYWRVRARNNVDTTVWSSTWTINTNDYVTQSSPSSGSNTWTTSTLNWTPHTGVSFYDIQIDSSNTFTSNDLRQGSNAYINSTDGNSDTQWSATNLYFGKTYYWRVRARNTIDSSAWSPIWTINTNDFVNLSSPAQGALNTSINPTMNWAPHPVVVSYQLQVDVSNLFNTTSLQVFTNSYINSTDGNSDTQKALTNLNPNTIYFWRVRAINTVDTSAWTQRWFSTGNAPLELLPAPSTVLPICGSSNNSIASLDFSWNAITGAEYYQIELKNSSLNGEPNYSNINSTSLSINNLIEGGNYCWRVRAVGNGNAGEWSNTCCFSTSAQISIAAPSTNESSYCQSEDLIINYATTGNFDGSNLFTVQLSNSNGSFVSPIDLGTFSESGSGSFVANIPNGIIGTGFKVRIISSNPIFVGDQSAGFQINELPILIGSLDAIVCSQTSSLELAEIVPSGGTYFGNTVNGTTFFPNLAGAGTFTVSYTYTDLNGCEATISGQIIVDECTTIDQSKIHPTVLQFDNYVQIIAPNNLPFIINIFDLSGKSYYSKYQLLKEVIIPTNHLSSGVYFIRWDNQIDSYTTKLVKTSH